MSIFQFLKSKLFFKHLAVYTLSVSLLSWLMLLWLSSSTNHGEVIKVPDFTNVKIADLDNFVSDKNVRYLIIDSIYDVKAPKASVLKQEPEIGVEVKENRTIYLYVNSFLPPQIQMPKLIDRSLRQAISMITTYGLKMGKTKFVPDQCANCILEQSVKGKKIKPGEKIEKGTIVDLIVGKGLSDEEVGLPCLYGLTRKEALLKLSDNSLSIGAITFDEPKDSAVARIYRQTPTCGKDKTIKMGATVDLFFTIDKNKIPAIPVSDSTNNSTTENFDE